MIFGKLTIIFLNIKHLSIKSFFCKHNFVILDKKRNPFNPILAGVLENQDTLGGGGLIPYVIGFPKN